MSGDTIVDHARRRRPDEGPVFPVRHGPRAGMRRRPKTSHAHRLRQGLILAGIFRLPPTDAPATKGAGGVRRGRVPSGTKLAPHPRDPLYFETPTSLPVDFHSFRRAFNTALAIAGVNVQKAMKLAGHTKAATHMRYVMQTPEMRAIPAAALPDLGTVAIGCDSPRSRANHREAEGGAEEDDDGANRVKSSVFADSQRPNPPLQPTGTRACTGLRPAPAQAARG